MARQVKALFQNAPGEHAIVPHRDHRSKRGRGFIKHRKSGTMHRKHKQALHEATLYEDYHYGI